jgi:phosphatidylglycerophosphate synthase
MADPPQTLTDRARALTGNLLTRLATACHRAGIHPDVISLAGLVLVVVAGLVIAGGQTILGGVILLVALPLDALDGAVARVMAREGIFGSVFDSTLDRYADGFIFGALGYHFARIDRLDGLALALAALLGSYTVSYVRARAGEAGLSVKIGLFSRLERSLVLIPALLLPPLLIPALVVLAVGTNFTGVQRVWYVYKHSEEST